MRAELLRFPPNFSCIHTPLHYQFVNLRTKMSNPNWYQPITVEHLMWKNPALSLAKSSQVTFSCQNHDFAMHLGTIFYAPLGIENSVIICHYVT